MTGPPAAFAVLTPPGTAAVATVAVLGPRAWPVVSELFRPVVGALPAEPADGQVWFGQFGPPPGDAVVLAVRSVTPNPWFELHCHGGAAVVALIAHELTRQGLIAVPAYDLVRVAGTSDLTASAMAALTRAPTLRTAAILLDQVAGAFTRAVKNLAAAADAEDWPCLTAGFAQLARHAPVGRHLTSPWRVALAGAPNVGKSSLVNALTGFERSVVTPVPGTTRDVVSTLTAIDGWPVELVDTAGRREASDDLEGRGIARGRLAMAEADLCLWILDQSAAPAWPDAATPCLIVINKSDLPAVWDISKAPDEVRVSAQTGDGLADLCSRISHALVPVPPPPGAAVPCTPELADRVSAAAAVRAPDGQPSVRETVRRLLQAALPSRPQ